MSSKCLALIQQGVVRSTQEVVLTSAQSREPIKNALEALRADLPNIELNEDDQSELHAEIGTIETQLGSSPAESSHN